ncbi:MAG: hypothetical protein ACJ8GK_10255 [Luteimonas sp.]
MHTPTQTPTDPDVDERQGHVPPVRNPPTPDTPPQPTPPTKR